jgi:hypothetical protein
MLSQGDAVLLRTRTWHPVRRESHYQRPWGTRDRTLALAGCTVLAGWFYRFTWVMGWVKKFSRRILVQKLRKGNLAYGHLLAAAGRLRGRDDPSTAIAFCFCFASAIVNSAIKYFK